MDVRGRRDDEVESTTAGFASACDQRRRQPAPLTRDGRIHGERVEGRFDDPEPLRSTRPLVVRRGDQHPEMQLREGCSADRPLEVARAVRTDQDGRVEDGSH